MGSLLNRRAVLMGATGLLAAAAAPRAGAADKIVLKHADTISEQDLRARSLNEIFAKEIGPEFEFQGYFNASLFKQGTELVAMQRGNLELANLAPQDMANQVPAWSLMTAAYLFRDPEHLKRVFKSDVGKEFLDIADKQLGVRVLAAPYNGTRHINLKPKKRISTPDDLAGIKLRMPGGETWQFMGKALGANPTPMAFTEVYTALQTGAIDAQDNPLPADKLMKFYEVTSQIVLTSHQVGYNLFSISNKMWTTLSAEQKARIQAAADKATDWSTEQIKKEEGELAAFFKSQGLEVYTPDVAAFRARAQKMYLESDLSKDWPKGALDRINAL
ncbi:MAG: sialic acid TRAP transporter substrate-binding protein SiaP [Proteobacteria bacterium]|nr:sialic acid TRAP transporter substrate-binding protein SiaP [Pseudomonadota bacterium]MBI3498256.1 sialic acid TRAP transporter substrate-binding protein SiaP [Pseudomonadota bacterium]